MKTELTPKQKIFVREYKLNGGNASKAALTAGYSKKTAFRAGQENMQKPAIKAALRKYEEKLDKKYEVTEERIIRELELLGFSDLQNYITIDQDTGVIQAKSFEKMPKNTSRALESISEDRAIRENADGSSVTVYDKRKFKMHSKIEALKLLANIKGMTREKEAQPQPIMVIINKA